MRRPSKVDTYCGNEENRRQCLKKNPYVFRLKDKKFNFSNLYGIIRITSLRTETYSKLRLSATYITLTIRPKINTPRINIEKANFLKAARRKPATTKLQNSIKAILLNVAAYRKMNS